MRSPIAGIFFAAALTAVSLALVFPSPANAQSRAGRELSSGYRYLNEMRVRAGMSSFRINPRLQRAAQGHSNYLSANRTSGHDQRRGRRGFTGRKPSDRTTRAGYPHQNVSENVSSGEKSARESVDALMSAIYHRFGFLSFDKDEVGFGLNFRKDFHRFTFNMGVFDLTSECRSRASRSGRVFAGRYFTPCLDKGIRIPAAAYQGIRQGTMKRNPRVVLWPVKGGTDVPPAFFDERPDPLPDYGVSGYPVSVQFNPFFVKTAELLSFRLFQHDGPIAKGQPNLNRLREIRNTRLLTRKSDPNRKFSGLEFALFPLLPFDWNQGYVADAVFVVNGRKERYQWHFTTRDPGAPVYKLTGRGEVLPLLPNREYVLYLPPANKQPSLKRMSWSAPRGVTVTLTSLDLNTKRVRIRGPICEKADFSFPGGRFSLRLAALDNTAARYPPQRLYAPCPEYAADYKLAGKNELIPVIAGREYKIYFAPSKRYPGITGISWRYDSGVRFQVDLSGSNTLTVKLSGRDCGRVTVTLKDGRVVRMQLADQDARGTRGYQGNRVPGC